MDRLVDWLIDLAKSKKWPISFLLLAAAATLYIWHDWKDFSELPGVKTLLASTKYHGSFPPPDPLKINIGVLHLDGDDDGEIEGDIVEDLYDILPLSVSVKKFDRIILSSDPSVRSQKCAYKISLVFLSGSSSLFGHDATASLPHRSSIRTKILRDLLQATSDSGH